MYQHSFLYKAYLHTRPRHLLFFRINFNRICQIMGKHVFGGKKAMSGTLCYIIQAVSRENMSLGFLTRSDTNQVVQPQEMARGLVEILDLATCQVEELYYVAKIKALISCAVTTQLICTFVFAHSKSRFSHTWLIYTSTSNQQTKKRIVSITYEPRYEKPNVLHM